MEIDEKAHHSFVVSNVAQGIDVNEKSDAEKSEIDGLEHQLDGHQDHNEIAPDDDSEHADGENHRAEDEIVVERHHGYLRFPLRQNHRADNRHKQQDRSDFKRQHKIGEKTLGERFRT